MTTTGSNQEHCETKTSSFAGQKIESDLVERPAMSGDTSAPAPKRGQVVAASSAAGSVWLAYMPKQKGIDNSQTVVKH